MPDPQRLAGRRYALTAAAIAALYFGAGKLGLSFAFTIKPVSAVWPPTGIALTALLLFGPRVWPAIFLGSLATNFRPGEIPWTPAGIAVGNTLGPLLGAWLLRRVARFDNAVTRLRDVFSLVAFGSMIAMLVTATNGVANLALRGFISRAEYGDAWWTWWVGDTMGVVFFAPLLLTWIADPRLSWKGWRAAEVAALFTTLSIASYVIFSGPSHYQIQYAVFPFLIWAALRFGMREVAAATVLMAGFAVWGTIHSEGPFATGTLDERLVLMDVFMAVAAIAGLVMGAVTAERSRAEEALYRAHGELEGRVQERTAALAAVNTELERKNEEVAAFVYTVSHDLRAPLVNLQGFASELRLSCSSLSKKLGGAPLPAELEKEVAAILQDEMGGALRYITAGTSKLERLIEALLRLSRSGREQYRSEAVDVGALVEATVTSLQKSVESSGAKVTVARPLPKAQGDSTAIEQVFANLIGNALHYLKPGRPGVIEIGGETRDSVASYWVRDNGVGIAESARPRLFQVFQRFHPDLAPGEGMGLAIAKRVVERHGGRIWAESEEGAGTTFRIDLPAAGRRPAI
ncbi:MAG TPA: MASE1 domain-containing protein [Myxococcaceae bacterium]|nr:MASE1 domain-containing protein [Myxococcaceae bacterium]